MINTNLRGLSKTSFPMQEGKTISWVAKYGSITFNQYGKEFPTGGMNERGLVVELMWLDETSYPTPDSRPAISVLQWIQYQLDNSSTVNDVISTDKVLRIASVGTTPLHYLVADKNGDAATIEFLNGRMTVHKGNELPFPVLANDTYSQSVSHFKSSPLLRANGSSLSRFSRACTMVEEYRMKKSSVSPIDYAFNILDKVSQGDFTKWSIVYDVGQSKIYLKTNTQRRVRSIDLTAFNFDCIAEPMQLDINSNDEGDVTKKFEAYSPKDNFRTVERSFMESNDRISVPSSYIDKIDKYQGQVRCK